MKHKFSIRMLLGVAATLALVSFGSLEVRAELSKTEKVALEAYDATQESGTLDNITWMLDGTTLEITGTGAMPEKGEGYPWEAYSFTKVIIGDGITEIPRNAFRDDGNIREVILSEGLETINSHAFSETGITSITIPNSCTEIGYFAFSYCSEMETIYGGKSVTKIGDGAFYACYELKTVSNLDNIKIIGNDAFAACDSLISVELSDAVETIGDNAFAGCLRLDNFTITSMNTTFKNNVFNNSPVTIHARHGSTAETYANDNSIPFEELKLDKVTNFKLLNLVSGVKLTWNEVRYADTYIVYRSESENGTYTAVKQGLTSTSYTDTTAEYGKTYYYKVEGVNDYAVSEAMSPKKHVFLATPSITSRTNLAAGIKLSWNEVENATGYAIYRKVGDGAWTRVYTAPNGSTLTWTDTAVKANNGKVYKYTVRALNGSTLSGCYGNGKTMVRLTSRTMSEAQKASETAIKCKWDASSLVSGYEVRLVVDGKIVKTVPIGNYKTYIKTLTGLEKGKKYQVQVRSFKKTDVGTYYSAWSTPKYVQL